MQSVKDLVSANIDKIDTAISAMYGIATNVRNIFSISITSTNMDYSSVSILQDTIILTGVLTGNTTLLLGSTLATYMVTNSCSGSNYYVYVRTASGSGVYLAQGCSYIIRNDGANIILVQSLTPRPFTLTTSGIASLTSTSVTVPISVTAGDTLSEIASNTFTAKNKCIVSICINAYISCASLSRATMGIITTSRSYYSMFTQSPSDGWIGGSTSQNIVLTAGQTLSLSMGSTGTSPALSASTNIAFTVL